MHQTTDLNNAGVAYLEEGDIGKALNLFRSALRHSIGDLRPVPGSPPTAPPPMTSASQDGPSSSRNTSSTSAPPQRSPTATATATTSLKLPGMAFIHAQGFGVVGTPGTYSPDILTNTTIVTTVVIVNLALVYHIKGAYEKSLSETRLIKAHSLYTKAHLLLHDAGVSFGSTGNAVVDLLAMAVLNNLAHVCFELASYEQSRAHFNCLIRFAMTVGPARYGDQHVGSFVDEQKSNFLLNAIILQAPNLASAA